MNEKFETKYFCKRCGYETTCLSNYRKHLRRVTLCKPKLRDISIDDDINKYVNVLNEKCIKCECGRSFSTRQGMYLHKRKCCNYTNVIDIERLNERISILEEENRILKCLTTTNQVTQATSIQNNINVGTINNNIHIHLKEFGHENI